jgi:threonine dehydratase
MFSIQASAIEKAQERLKPYINNTPILKNEVLNDIAGCDLFFKCENFQKINAFKARGAINAALKLTEEQKINGLATHSSGNHAQAVAYAAKLLHTQAFIVMPDNSPQVKVEGVQYLGGNIVFCEANQKARENTIEEIVAETGAAFIHPYNDLNVIEGQATCAKEFHESVDLDYLIAPVGGGGLLSGTLLSTHYFKPNVKVFGAEPQQLNDAWQSLKKGEIVAATGKSSVADGLMTSLGSNTFPIIKNLVSDILLADEEEIIDAMLLIYRHLKVVIEPSCAVPLAVILKNKTLFSHHKLGIILTGGNIDMNRLSTFIENYYE